MLENLQVIMDIICARAAALLIEVLSDEYRQMHEGALLGEGLTLLEVPDELPFQRVPHLIFQGMHMKGCFLAMVDGHLKEGVGRFSIVYGDCSTWQEFGLWSWIGT